MIITDDNGAVLYRIDLPTPPGLPPAMQPPMTATAEERQAVQQLPIIAAIEGLRVVCDKAGASVTITQQSRGRVDIAVTMPGANAERTA